MAIEKYNFWMRSMHWISGIGFISTLLFGYLLANTELFKGSLYLNTPLHKSFGISIFFLVVMRLAIRMGSELPPDLETPARFMKAERFLAKLTHYGLYFFMLEIPLVGFLMSNLSGKPVSFFKLFIIPPILGVNKDLAKTFYTVHKYGAYIALFFIGLHLLGSMKHLIFDRVNLFKRIV